LFEQLNNLLSPSDAKLLYINTLAPIGFTIFIKGKNQVDITGEIQLLRAMLTHGDHD
jgi:hypothetical protein